jgi:putative restriction endonuclease
LRFWVGVTDKAWFDFLSVRVPDEVNFWQPSAKPVATFLTAGMPFLFKLHSPHNFVVGGGFFVRFSALPARLAWEAFRDNNGVADYEGLKRRVEQYRKAPIRGDPEIGCNVLNGPFFFAERDWIPIPESWSQNIVRGRSFDTMEPDGARLWGQLTDRLKLAATAPPELTEPRFGAEYLTRARLGQGAFRVLVTEAYSRRCAITGERTLPVLEAAHIQPYARQGPHVVANGLLLREDLHTLFDDGYLTITEELRVEVSRRIKEKYQNGREYYRYDGAPLTVVPSSPENRPSMEFIRWHNTQVYER